MHNDRSKWQPSTPKELSSSSSSSAVSNHYPRFDDIQLQRHVNRRTQERKYRHHQPQLITARLLPPHSGSSSSSHAPARLGHPFCVSLAQTSAQNLYLLASNNQPEKEETTKEISQCTVHRRCSRRCAARVGLNTLVDVVVVIGVIHSVRGCRVYMLQQIFAPFFNAFWRLLNIL